MMTRESLKARADRRGYDLHESITDERLAACEPELILGQATGVPEAMRRAYLEPLEVEDEINVDALSARKCIVVPYRIGRPGETVIAPPTTDEALKLLHMPAFTVVRHVVGHGEETDGESISSCELVYTILEPSN